MRSPNYSSEERRVRGLRSRYRNLHRQQKPQAKQKSHRRKLWEWTGFGETKLRDWLQILLVPGVLAAIGIAYAGEQGRTQALQSYLGQMSELLTEHESTQLYRLEPDEDVERLVAARTSTVLEQLDGNRQRSAIRFLAEADLLGIIPLAGLDLYGIDLHEADLSGADLLGTDLTRANLGGAYLSRAQLVRAYLRGANLARTDMSGAKLGGADLSGANMRDADLSGVDLSDADLSDAANLTQEQIERAVGNESAKLPNHIQRPEAWSEDARVQLRRLREEGVLTKPPEPTERRRERPTARPDP